MGRRGPSYTGLQRILARQGGTPKWGHDYVPANFIDDVDAPGSTRPSGIYVPEIDRDVQAQAKTERPLILFALHYPRRIDLHEQKMLHFNPVPHPLAGHPMARGMDLPMLRGTLAVADAMGELRRHPVVRAPADHPTHPNQLLPYPYLGDLLLYLEDDEGPYCVNWSIKATEADFHRTYRARNRPISEVDRAAAEFRQELERQYYLDGATSTHQLFPDKMDSDLRANLLTLHYWWARAPEDERTRIIESDMLAWYREQLQKIIIQFDLAKLAAARFETSIYDAKWVLKKGIFDRQLRVELFVTVLDNLPLLPEREDPFVRYAPWFARRLP